MSTQRAEIHEKEYENKKDEVHEKQEQMKAKEWAQKAAYEEAE